MAIEPIPKRFSLGVCYYPEQWPQAKWAEDARRMRELGIRYVRIGEFAWSRIEPAPGRLRWDWLDEAIATLADAGLRVVLGTPTAAPPAWLVRRHPEILPVGPDGHVRGFGSRRHYDFASPVYRAACRRIVTALAERYGRDPAVEGWQVDNEFGDHDTGVGYGPGSRDAFRCWLEQRYGPIAALNEAWGTVFWSQTYGDWAEIDSPNLTVGEPNPSHLLDYRRFASDMVAAFLEEQVAILRALSPGRWVTHNYMRLCGEFDHFRNAASLDFVTWDGYPTGALSFSELDEAEQLRWARSGHPDLMAFNHDLHRGFQPGRGHWIMEGQAGHINWAPSNPLPDAGAVRLWAAEAWAHGADCVSYFRWRASTAGQEMMHSGLLRHDGSPDRGADELRGLDLVGLPNEPVANSVVLLLDYESLWLQEVQRHAERAGYWRQVMLFYAALRSLGVGVDVRHPDADLAGYRLIVAPALQVVGEARARHLARYAEARLVFGPRAGFRTPSGAVHADGQPGPLRPLLGWSLLNVDGLRQGLTVRAGGFPVGTWAEAYRLHEAEALIRYDDGPLAGEAAVVRRGNAVTVGAWSAGLVTHVMERLLEEAGIATVRLPDGVRRAVRGSREVWLNFGVTPCRLPNGRIVGPLGYAVQEVAAGPRRGEW